MKIMTTRFGEVDVKDTSCFEFEKPILGYENEKSFVLIEHKDKSCFTWLQSVTNPDLAFVLTMAGLFDIDYTIEIPSEVQEMLEIEDADDILVFNIVVIPQGNPRLSSINLLAPIILNINNQKGAQLVLSGTKYVVDHPLFKDKEKC